MVCCVSANISACSLSGEHVLVSRDTSQDNVYGATRILASALLLRCNCNWPPCTWCSLLAKTKTLSMSSPSQPGSTVSLSTSCCTLKGGTLPVAIVQAPSRDPVVEFMSHLQRDGNSCGAADKNIIMNIAHVSPAVAETLLHETRGISNLQCPQTVLSTTRGRKSMPSKRESISMVACVKGDRVRLARSHCVLRQTDSSWADPFKIPVASTSKVTSI